MLRDVVCDAMERQHSYRALVAAQDEKIARLIDLLRTADMPLDQVVKQEQQQRRGTDWKRQRHEKHLEDTSVSRRRHG